MNWAQSSQVCTQKHRIQMKSTMRTKLNLNESELESNLSQALWWPILAIYPKPIQEWTPTNNYIVEEAAEATAHSALVRKTVDQGTQAKQKCAWSGKATFASDGSLSASQTNRSFTARTTCSRLKRATMMRMKNCMMKATMVPQAIQIMAHLATALAASLASIQSIRTSVLALQRIFYFNIMAITII